MKQLINMKGIGESAPSDNTAIIKLLGTISNIIIVCCLLFATNTAADTPSGKYTKWQPGHYMRVSFSATDINDPVKRSNLLASVRTQAKRPEFKGVLLQWYWNHIEPKKDAYDFSIVDEILAILEDEDKYLMLRPMERVFTNRCQLLPDYLDSLVDGKGTMVPSGKARCFTRIWEKPIMDRWIKLNEEIAARYDNHPRLVGNITEETAVSVSRTGEGGYAVTKYTDEMVRFSNLVGPAFSHTIVFQSLNFLGGGKPNNYFDEILESVLSHNTGGLTHPDTSPCKDGNYVDCDPESQSPSYPPYFYEREYGSKGTGELAVMAQIQWGTWLKGLTPDQFYGTVYDYLGSNFVVWDGHTTNFNSEFVPYFQMRNYEVIETCPSKLTPCYTGSDAPPVNAQRPPAAPVGLTLSFD